MRTTSPGLCPTASLYYVSCAAFVGLCRQAVLQLVAGRLAGIVTSGLWQRHACRSTWKPQHAIAAESCETRIWHALNEICGGVGCHYMVSYGSPCV